MSRGEHGIIKRACSDCGTMFFTTLEDRTLCRKCRDGHIEEVHKIYREMDDEDRQEYLNVILEPRKTDLLQRQCPTYPEVKEGSLACEECDHWVVVRVIEPNEECSIPFAVQACDLLPSRRRES